MSSSNIKILSDTDYAYIAGIIDSEGSFTVSKLKRKRDGATIRTHRLKIKMTDPVVIPLLSKLLKVKSDKNNTISFSKTKALQLIEKIYPYLYTKQPRALIFKRLAEIKTTNTPYTDEENNEWDKLHEKLKWMNSRGSEAPTNDGYTRNHIWHWAWVAGMIDGDGSIVTQTWSIQDRKIIKPVVQIALTNEETIEYLSKRLDVPYNRKIDKRPNRRPNFRIRILPTNQIRLLPHIIPYLVFKKELGKLALEISKSREANHMVSCQNQIEKMKEINSTKYN